MNNTQFKRIGERKSNQLRNVKFDIGYTKHAEGSCLVHFGGTKVLCTATVEEKVPPFLRNTGKGWVTAEYSMLPRATHSRIQRESAKGKIAGRTQEIQRLIGRALRAAVDLNALGERQVIVDCDVLQADGGTRTASICGGFVALHQALHNLKLKGRISKIPVKSYVAAVSCGILDSNVLIDLDYSEDSIADVDANFVMDSYGKIIELQGSAEGNTFVDAQFLEMLSLAKSGISSIIELQKEALKQVGVYAN